MIPKITILICSRVEGNVNHALINLLDSILANSRDHKNIDILVKYDEDDSLALTRINEIYAKRYPFSVRQFFGERGRGYIDIHEGYNLLLQYVLKETLVVGAMADDFTVERDWDQKILDAIPNNQGYFIIHQRPHPSVLRPDYHVQKFSMVEDMFNGEDLHIIDEAPLWSKALIDAIEYFPVSFTDAWTLCLEWCLWNHYGYNITRFLDRIYINRTTCEVDQPTNKRWHKDRKVNFDYIKSEEFHDIVARQANHVGIRLK